MAALPALSLPGSFRGPEGWAAVVQVLSHARKGVHGVGGGPRGTHRRVSAARPGDRAAVLIVARMVASWRCEGPCRAHSVTEHSRHRCREVTCEGSATRPTCRSIHVSLQRTYADPGRMSRWAPARVGRWSDETGVGNVSIWAHLGSNRVSASVLRQSPGSKPPPNSPPSLGARGWPSGRSPNTAHQSPDGWEASRLPPTPPGGPFPPRLSATA
jgi:hypothetical protein